MVIAIGVDIVDRERFDKFHLYSHQQLLRIFSPREIAYCLEIPVKSAERFAVRFAAKEALYKALCQLHQRPVMPFLTLCQSVEVVKNPFPEFLMCCENDWLRNLKILLSLSHCTTTALAQVTLIQS